MSLLFWQGRGGRAGAGPGGAAATTPTSTTNGGTTTQGRAWLHAPDLLLKGHVAYLVKFLGTTTVDQPKGIEVVKNAIRKLQFTQQVRKSETGAKTRKVEITISVDGVAIQEPRTNNILHQFPLHRISYCADDKEAKKFFSFIAKAEAPSPSAPEGEATTNTNGQTTGEQHECFVFISNKLASEITLTIGQAFDLAYRRFLMERGAGAEAAGLEAARAKAQAAEFMVRTRELAALLQSAAPTQLSTWMSAKNISHATEWNQTDQDLNISQTKQEDNLLSVTPPVYSSNNHIPDLMNNSIDMTPPSKNPSVGTKLEGLLLNSDSDSDFDPRAAESDLPAAMLSTSRARSNQQASPTHNGGNPPPLLAPPPKANKRLTSPPNNIAPVLQNGNTTNGNSDLFGSTPFAIPSKAQSILLQQPGNNLISSPGAPNYNLSDFSAQGSIFPPTNNVAPMQNNNPQNGTQGMVGFDPFDTGKFGSVITNGGGFTNGFSNPMGNGFGVGNNGLSNGFGNPFPFGNEKQNNAILDSSFSGFLDKRISEMKDGFSRGLVIGNEDFFVDNLDPLKRN